MSTPICSSDQQLSQQNTVLPWSPLTGSLQGVTKSGAALQEHTPGTQATGGACGTEPELVQHLKNTFMWTLGFQDQHFVISIIVLLLLHSTN